MSKDSVFMIDEKGALASLKENHVLSNFIKSENDHSYSIESRNVNLKELELSIDAYDFIDKVKQTQSIKIKIVPSTFMRSVLVKNLNKISQLNDLNHSFKKLTGEIKKIYYSDDLINPGLNQGMCIVEYNSHSNAKNAIKILNNSSNNPVYQIICNKYLQAYWAEPFIDNVKELFCGALTSVFYFEILNINTYNLFHFKNFIETSFDEKILRVRQYTQKVMIEFERSVNIPAHINYEGRHITVQHGMHPNNNINRYKEKIVKVVPMQLSDHDRKTIVSVVEDSPIENLRKKAEGLYNKLSNNDYITNKREREEKKPERRREERREVVREDRREMVRNDRREMVRDDRKEVVRDSYRRQSRDRRERSNDYDRSNKKFREDPIQYQQQQQSDPNQNILTQLSSLLQGNQSMNVLSGIANLNQLLSNPGLLSTIQQLTCLNKPQPIQHQHQQPITPQHQQPPQQHGVNTINPVYNLKPQDSQFTVPQYNLRQQSTPSQVSNFYPNQQQYQYPEQSNMYMPPQYIEQNQSTQQTMPNEIDQQMQMMKKYYEYMQSLNK